MALLINIGFGNTVNSAKVLAVVSPDAAPVRRMITSARESGMLIDATQGRKTKAVIILEAGRVLLSALQPETVMRRFNAESGYTPGTDEDPAEQERTEGERE